MNKFLKILIKIPSNVTERSQRGYVLLASISLIGIILHLLFIVMFLYFQITIMVIYNVFSVFSYCILLVLLHSFNFSKISRLCGTIAGLEVMAHAVLSVIFIGWASGFQYYILASTAIIPLISNDIKKKKSFAWNSYWNTVNILSFIGLVIFVKGTKPVYQIQASYLRAMDITNTTVMILLIALMGYLFIDSLIKSEDKASFEYQRAEGLLRNILPTTIADRLKADPHTIADGFDCATVLFSDIVDFTKLSEKLSPSEVVACVFR